RPRHVVAYAIDHLGDDTVGRGKDLAAEGIIVLVSAALSFVCLAVGAYAEQVKCKALGNAVVVVVQLGSVAAPEDEPPSVERKRQLRLVLLGNRQVGPGPEQHPVDPAVFV